MKKYFFRQRKKLSIHVIISIIAAAVEVGIAFVYGAITDAASDRDLKRFLLISVVAVLYIFCDSLMDYLPRFTRANLVQGITMDIRNSLVYKIEKTKSENFINTDKASLVSKLVNEMKVIEEEYLNPTSAIIKTAFVFVFSLISSITLQGSLTLIIIILSIFPLIAPYIAKRILSDKKEDMILKQKKFLEKYEELVQKFLTLKIANSFSFINKLIFRHSEELRESKVAYAKAQGKTYAVSYGLGQIVYTGTWIVGGIFVALGRLEISELIAMTTLSSMIAGPIQHFADSFTELLSSKKVADNFIKFLEDPQSDEKEFLDLENNLEDINSIKLEKICYEKSGKLIVDEFSYEFNDNKKYAIIGESGSGKTSILFLLTGVYEPTDGQVLINGKNLKDISKEEFYSKIAFISQKTDIFNTSFANNVSLFKDYKPESIVDSLEKAGLSKLLDKNNNDIEVLIGEGNVKISGGEERRIDIARSLFKNATVLVFDEPTTGLDKENEYIIRDLIDEMKDKLIIVVTHTRDEEFLSIFDEIIEI